MISVHDNYVYGLATSFTKQRCVLHTKFPRDGQKAEFTDIVFDGVVAIQLDDICLRQSILGEIYEKDPADFFDDFEDVFKVEENGVISSPIFGCLLSMKTRKTS